MHNDGLFILVHVAFNFLDVDNADATLTSTACSHVLVQNTKARWLVECYSGALPRLATVVSDTVRERFHLGLGRWTVLEHDTIVFTLLKQIGKRIIIDIQKQLNDSFVFFFSSLKWIPQAECDRVV